jgi:hypothetical protein
MFSSVTGYIMKTKETYEYSRRQVLTLVHLGRFGADSLTGFMPATLIETEGRRRIRSSRTGHPAKNADSDGEFSNDSRLKETGHRSNELFNSQQNTMNSFSGETGITFAFPTSVDVMPFISDTPDGKEGTPAADKRQVKTDAARSDEQVHGLAVNDIRWGMPDVKPTTMMILP